MRNKISGRALVFTYRTLSRFFHEVCERTFEEPSTFCSSWPGLESVNLQTNFYRHYNDRAVNHDLSEHDYLQIIARSCVLRLLPWEQSKRMVDAMYRTIDDLTDQVRPDYLLSGMVDNYMTDLLARICEMKQIRVVMLAAGSMDNTIIVTRYGEFNKVREPQEEELNAALAKFLDDTGRVTYSQNVKNYSVLGHFSVFATWWAKCLYFKAKGWLSGDPLNFRYLMGTLRSRDGQSSFWGYRSAKYFDNDWEEQLTRGSLPSLFIPLSYTPEASTSYWLKDLHYIDYDDFIIDTARKLSSSYQVVIKDHWSMLGVRRLSFYQRLKSIPGVVLVPAGVNSRKVMSLIERVLVGAGTTGIEAALRGKRVATLDKPYYFVEGSFMNVGSAERLEDLPRLLEAFDWPVQTDETRRKLVRRMLQATIIGHFLPDRRLNSEQNYHTTSTSLTQYLSASEGLDYLHCGGRALCGQN